MLLNNRKTIVSLLAGSVTIAFGWATPAIAQDSQDDSEWSISPRGRAQIDAGGAWASDAVEAAADAVTPGGLDFGGEVRRFYLGVDGTMPGNLGFRFEGDFAGVFEGDSPSWTDAYVYWKPSDAVRVTLGNQKPFWGLEEVTSDLFTSFSERAAINTAFGNKRRVGVSLAVTAGDVLLQGGAFTDDLDSIIAGSDKGHSFDGRAVFMPELAGGQFHLGGSLHVREFDDPTSAKYSVRPFVHTADTKFVSTGTISDVTGETAYGLELGWISGPLHVTGETRWQHVERAGALAEPTFFGGYAEIGYFLTKGDSRGYKGGNFDRTKPVKPLGKGGIGAVQLNARYDYLDLADAGFAGGAQNAYQLSLVWTPSDRTRFIANYARLEYDGSPIAVGADNSYGADAFGVRAQFDF